MLGENNNQVMDLISSTKSHRCRIRSSVLHFLVYVIVHRWENKLLSVQLLFANRVSDSDRKQIGPFKFLRVFSVQDISKPYSSIVSYRDACSGNRSRSDSFYKKMESSLSPKTLQGNAKVILKLVHATLPQKDHEKEGGNCTEQHAEALESREVPEEECTQVNFMVQEPEWLENFLRKTFFEHCPEHPIRRNELNRYCIDCDAPLCQYCISLACHDDHKLLKIYRHVYKDVVPLDEIEQHIDCSQIQPYRCNRQMVIALSPLPHSGANTNEEVACITCRRKLIEYDVYSFCSISCKVEAFANAREETPSPPPPPPPPPPLPLVEVKPQLKTTRKRKGIPHRAPFF